MIMNELNLTKESTENEIKTYFQTVLELKQAGDNFPVDLELVWTLVYTEKGKAVRALKSDFIENEDYVCLPFMASGKNERVTKGGHNALVYKLSVSCMEYFIARKVRSVFDVYRKVFHKVVEAEQKPISALDALKFTVQALEEQDRRLHAVESKVSLIIERQIEAENELKMLPVSSEKVPEITLRDKCRLLVNRYCSVTGVYQQSVWDNVYQTLYYNYHIAVKSYQKSNKSESWLDVAVRKGFVDKIYDVISNMLKDKGIAA
jgi:hypothetical protein